MIKRRDFIQNSVLASALLLMPEFSFAAGLDTGKVSAFAKKLKPVGRALEMEGYYVWCNSPIYGPDGKVHLFFSRWVAKKGMGGWLNGCEICHAIADTPESEFKYVETILAPRGLGFWDATTCHNPFITELDGKYFLFFMGTSNGKTDTKRIGLATAPSLNGPWARPDEPLLLPGDTGAWDDHCTTNPAVVKHDGKYLLFYKSWNSKEYQESKHPTIRGNRKYGLAIADQPEGPYIKYSGNPVIDFSGKGDNAQMEDAFIWTENNSLNMICRDMGVYNHEYGLLMNSKNGTKWSKPEIAYYDAPHYINQPPPAPHLRKYGRFERPQILLKDGKPTYLFTTSQGGKYMTASPFIFKIEH
ncbi:glycoside hydrolase family protein [Pedobacter sp.]|uniref:glycoside hydrolase family protein n=1 Tax=Pedobacter sp. TaxID=1411316 RepID=UPI003D7FB179